MSCCILGCPNNIVRGNKETTYHLFPHPFRERYRHAQWLEASNNPKLLLKDPMKVYKTSRICRRHFAKDCFNGACRRLLITAVPTLHLNKTVGSNKRLEDRIYSFAEEETSVFPTESPVGEITYQMSDVKGPEGMDFFKVEQEHLSDVDANDIEDEENSFVDESVVSYESEQETLEIENVLEKREEQEKANSKIEDSYDLIEVLEDEPFSPYSLSLNELGQWRTSFLNNSKNVLAQNACINLDPFILCQKQEILNFTSNYFNFSIDSKSLSLLKNSTERKPWLFTILQCIRLAMVRHYNLDEFEFSEAYLLYWDKIERCNYYLNKVTEALLKGEELNGRQLSFLLKNPISNGGRWNMLQNIIKKYGLVPKSFFPNSYCIQNEEKLNQLLNSKLREFTKSWHKITMVQDGIIRNTIKEQMTEIHSIVSICLGIPPENFLWEYYDTNRKYCKVGPVTPLEFYKKSVKVCFDVEKKVCITNDPRPDHPYEKLYSIECIDNVVGNDSLQYNNQPIDVLLEATVKSIKQNNIVWIAGDLTNQRSSVFDIELYDRKVLFDVKTDSAEFLNKSDRLYYGESKMTHGLLLTAVLCDDDGKPQKFQVQSPNTDKNNSEIFGIMSVEWFREFIFEIVVDHSILPNTVLSVFYESPIKMLPPWDPMGALVL